MLAIEIAEFGGPEVLAVVERPEPEPRRGWVRIDVSSAGVNFADTHLREDAYLTSATLPLIPGGEVVGTRADTGERVAAFCGSGGYAAVALAHEALAFPLPPEVSDAAALALLTQGLTAWHVLRTCARLAEGESVVVHAGAGGVGSLAIQLATQMNAGRIIATASTDSKRAITRELGAQVAIDPDPDGLTERLLEANDGKPVDVVLEIGGGRCFDASLAAVAPLGRLVVYGAASGQTNHLATAELMSHSRAVIGFWLVHCLRDPRLSAEPFAKLVSMVQSGQLEPLVSDGYQLADAAQAHRDLENRMTIGKVVLSVA